LVNDQRHTIVEKIRQRSVELQDISYVTVGINTGYIRDLLVADHKVNAKYHPMLSGSDISRYQIEWQGEYIMYDPTFVSRQGDRGRTLPPEYIFEKPKILLQRTRRGLDIKLIPVLDKEGHYNLNRLSNVVMNDDSQFSVAFVTALLASSILDTYFNWVFQEYEVKPVHLRRLPIRRIDFTTPADEREHRVNLTLFAYEEGDDAALMQSILNALVIDNQTDVVHDVLAHLAERMIDLNKEKQAEVGRFLGWLEGKLRIKTPHPPTPSPTAARGEGESSPSPLVGEGFRVRGNGIDSLTGKTIIQGYLGDYQKGAPETSWADFYFRLHQNRNRFGVSLADVDGEIQRAYEQSLEMLIPIKRDLARTDALIDKIVYRLYGLTDAEIELIERPQYEQALTDAKAQVVADEKITDDEEKLEKIAEGILSASNRFFERVETPTDEEVLDRDLPNWRNLPPDAPKFLLTGDYALRTFPDHMDFSSSVIPYSKAVEVALHKLIFEPFRTSHSDRDCRNEFLQKFMRGEKELTLGSYMIILSSNRETALRGFISRIVSDVEGLATTLNDTIMRDVRNKAAHDEVLSRDEAQQTRTWAIGILGMV